MSHSLDPRPDPLIPQGLRKEIVAICEEAEALASELVASPLGHEAATAGRLQASVVRPLARICESTPGPQHRTQDKMRRDGNQTPYPERLTRLAVRATKARSRPGAPPALLEATAALQQVSLEAVQSTGTDARDSLLAEFEALQTKLPLSITVSTDGPYLATNLPSMRDNLGLPLEVWPQMALCRCGGSAIKPLCDGTHARIGFSGVKDPGRVPDRRDTYRGSEITILDNRGICAHSGFCTDRLASVFHANGDPFVTPSGGRMDEVIRAVRGCPSGALSFAFDAREAREYVDRSGRPPQVEVSKDGPYRITGAIPLTDSDGTPIVRAAGSSLEHCSLCRCGQSQNKPFCSGRHWYVGFSDPKLSDEPTLFEWAGGLPALSKITRRFFETLVPSDELLSPVYAEMDPDLPQRLATWLASAFGQSNLADGDPANVAGALQEIGTMDERTRQRWVQLFERAADDVGLPADAEFRAAFTSFLEWASRSIGAPDSGEQRFLVAAAHWGWGPAGRPAKSDVSAPTSAQPAIILPGPDDGVFFDQHIAPLFRGSDRDAMRWAFDLGSYEEVSANASSILQRLQSGSMPCDGAWPEAWVGLFQRWVDSGTPKSPTTPAAAGAGQPEVGSRQRPPDSGTAQQSIDDQLERVVHLRGQSPAGDQALVIEHREPLIYMLCSAAELEHALMCEYLFAAFSLKGSVDEGLSAEQLEAVERWRSALLFVAKQEMLHLAINCNLVNSLGASPHLSRPNLPQPAKHYPPGVILTLLPFGEQALRHFLYLERPEGMDFEDAEGLAAIEGAKPVMSEDKIAPQLQEFATVGHLYRSIEEGFRHLAEKLGEDSLFVTPASEQVSGELFGWPQLQPVTCLVDAVRGIETIVEQGEGSRGDWRNAHFGRFLKVLEEYLAMKEANPDLEVARRVLPALVRPPETGESAELITDGLTGAIADLGNVTYEVLLQILYRLFCHVDEDTDQMKTLSDVAIGLMFGVVEPIGALLTTLPVGPENPGRTAGLSFELFYQPDYLLPHRKAAWQIMAEHLADAAEVCDHHGATESRLVPIAQALKHHADTLRSGAT